MIATHNTSSRWLWWILGAVALLRLLTLGLYPLTDTTEARYAEVARKMAELGNWVTPLYDYGVPFWAKPPLTTWLSAISIQLFGVNEFAARLPYFLLAVLIAWLLWAWVRRSSDRQAQLAVAIMSGTLLYVIASAAVMTDLGLLLGTTLAMRGFWAAFEPRESSRPKEVWLLFIGMGIGLLAKGPIAVVLSGLPIGLWMLVTGNIKTSWQRLPWVKGSLLTLAIAAHPRFLGILFHRRALEPLYRHRLGWRQIRHRPRHPARRHLAVCPGCCDALDGTVADVVARSQSRPSAAKP